MEGGQDQLTSHLTSMDQGMTALRPIQRPSSQVDDGGTGACKLPVGGGRQALIDR